MADSIRDWNQIRVYGIRPNQLAHHTLRVVAARRLNWEIQQLEDRTAFLEWDPKFLIGPKKAKKAKKGGPNQVSPLTMLVEPADLGAGMAQDTLNADAINQMQLAEPAPDLDVQEITMQEFMQGCPFASL